MDPINSIAVHFKSLPPQIDCYSENELFEGNLAAWKGAIMLIAPFTRSTLSGMRSLSASGSLVESTVFELGLQAS